MKNKVFGIGLQKTGTSSLGKALKTFGYNVNQTDYAMMKKLIAGDKQSIRAKAECFDGFEDNPWPIVYKDLDRWFPGSKFILTVRDKKNWLRSIIRHFGKKTFEFEQWYYGVDYPIGNESVYVERFENHNMEVLEYFKDRPNDLLVVDWEKGDDWDKLCTFLEQKVPSRPFPHLNRNKTFTDRVKKKYRGALIRLKKMIKKV